MKITLVRHTEVDEEYIGCYNGHNDIGLSEKGHTQAKELSKRLEHYDFDALLCSDLFRAKETIKHFSFAKDIIYTEKLREKSWGRHEGLSFNEIVSQNEIEYINFSQWIKDLDGEPYEEYIKGLDEFFTSYLPSLNKEHVLLVTHAGVIRCLISLVQNITLEEAFGKKVKNGSYITYDTKSGDFTYENI